MARTPEHCSIPAQIEALKPGQSYSKSVRLEVGNSDSSEGRESLAKMRSIINQAAARLRDKGMVLRVESVSGLTADFKAAIFTVCVTHMAAGDDEDDI